MPRRVYENKEHGGWREEGGREGETTISGMYQAAMRKIQQLLGTYRLRSSFSSPSNRIHRAPRSLTLFTCERKHGGKSVGKKKKVCMILFLRMIKTNTENEEEKVGWNEKKYNIGLGG
jgi:hypothetical protein